MAEPFRGYWGLPGATEQKVTLSSEQGVFIGERPYASTALRQSSRRTLVTWANVQDHLHRGVVSEMSQRLEMCGVLKERSFEWRG